MAPILKPLQIGTQKQLFLDNGIVEDTWGLKRTYFAARKHPANPLIRGRYPWEDGGLRLYGTVLREDGTFRMWYTGKATRPHASFMCYATSADGLTWERLALGLVELGGSTENNIVFYGEGSAGGGTVLRDGAEVDADRRYKMAYGDRNGVGLAFSPDGLHWRASPTNPIHTHSNDTHIVLLKDLTNSKWLIYARPETYAGHWKRRVALSESDDLEKWTEFSNVLVPDELDPPEFYYLIAFAYEGMYVGLVAPYRSATSSSMDARLVSSRDGVQWQRPLQREQFIPLGDIGQFDSHIIWMSSAPVQVGDELWFYYCGFQGRHDWAPHQAAIGLATLRLDGFCCLDATDPVTVGEAVAAARVDYRPPADDPQRVFAWPDEGSMITRPFIWDGDELQINAWAPYGEVRVEMIDATTPPTRMGRGPCHGAPFAGLEMETCDPFSGDAVRHVVSWRGQHDLRKLRGHPVRLRFVLRAAQLFAFQPVRK